ncbi:hypothetical protein KO493_01850 [Tamlana agarivorans]|uniref:Uncharacterized protein n=1 Tax=Pseudotamlana agarivorans TaxID=481183 RepID=A0ACC5U536_9FLAO|nr:hypothetical protein [Tamlana agarivorans]MBU2949434.1 hypothetical protein [Tamlana agarivorans]
MLSLKNLLVLFLLFPLILISQASLIEFDQQFNKIENKDKKLSLLDSVTKQLIRANSPEQVGYIKDYIKLAVDLKDYDKAASKSRFLMQFYNNTGDLVSQKKLIDSMLQFEKRFKKSSSKAHILLKRGAYYFVELDYTKAAADYQASIPLFFKSNDSIYAADAYYYSGQANFKLNHFPKAVEDYEKASNLYVKLGDLEYALSVGQELSSLYSANGLKKPAKAKREEIIELSEKVGNPCSRGITELLLLGTSLKDEQNEFSESDFEHIHHIIKQCDDDLKSKRFSYYLYTYKTSYYSKKANLKKAKESFDTMVALEKSLNVKFEEAHALKPKAEYYALIGEDEKAITVIKTFLKSLPSQEMSSTLLDAEKLLAKLYLKHGKFKLANEHLQSYISIKDTLFTRGVANSYAYYHTRFETSEKEKEIIQQEAEIQKLEDQKTIEASKKKLYLSVGSSLFVILMLSGYFVSQKAKKKRELLAVKLEEKQKELNVFTKKLLDKSEAHQSLETELEHLKSTFGEREELNELKSLTESKILTSEDWDDFKMRFSDVYPHFFLDLRNLNCKITNSEERLLALEKLKLNTSEIAAMLGISPDSVNTSRYRLRKKLEAPKDIGLVSFIEKEMKSFA